MLDQKQHIKLSKFLSLVLRHKPEEIGIQLDNTGWTSVCQLLEKMNQYGKTIDFETLEFIVENNAKKRFCFNDDKTLVRANQGHSVTVDLGYQEKPVNEVPSTLYHGTANRFVTNIYQVGAIQKMQRHHVHLSRDIGTAKSVGQRHGKLVIFAVDTKAMLDEGHKFYQSDNDVWLTDEIDVKFLNKVEI